MKCRAVSVQQLTFLCIIIWYTALRYVYDTIHSLETIFFHVKILKKMQNFMNYKYFTFATQKFHVLNS